MNLKYLFSRSKKLLPVNISGFIAALCAYVIWGLFPLYMKAVSHISLMEILAHRVLWSIPIALFVLIVAGRINDLWAAMKNAKIIAMACLTSTLITGIMAMVCCWPCHYRCFNPDVKCWRFAVGCGVVAVHLFFLCFFQKVIADWTNGRFCT